MEKPEQDSHSSSPDAPSGKRKTEREFLHHEREKNFNPAPDFFGNSGDLGFSFSLTVLADVELAEVDQAGDGGREAGEVVVRNAELPQRLAVEELLFRGFHGKKNKNKNNQ